MPLIELQTRWCQLLGTHNPSWPSNLRAFAPHLYRARRELTPRGERTVLIEGPVSNFPSVRDGNTALASRTAFDHGGHLIAARFGGPTCDENLVPMHGVINMRGGRWSNMEDQIARLLGGGKGTMRVRALYSPPPTPIGDQETEEDEERYSRLYLRPMHFSIELQLMTGHHVWEIPNTAPYMTDPRSPEHWRSRILEELKRRKWSISSVRRQSLLACREAPRLERLYRELRAANGAAPAFRLVGL